jgi:hypothetical protein
MMETTVTNDFFSFSWLGLLSTLLFCAQTNNAHLCLCVILQFFVLPRRNQHGARTMSERRSALSILGVAMNMNINISLLLQLNRTKKQLDFVET